MRVLEARAPLAAKRQAWRACLGGGGYGDPRKLDPQFVADDVRHGYVSLQAVRETCGIVLDAAGDVLAAETAAQRECLARHAPA